MPASKGLWLRGALNAWLLDVLEAYMHRKYGHRKGVVFEALPDQVVEIGPGAGANLRYYAPGTHLIAIEPNRSVHELLRANAARHRVRLDIRNVRGEAIDLDSASIEAVVGTLVLCSVGNPRQVVTEVHRILKPGGRYIFLEHVAAMEGSHLRTLQEALHHPWHLLFDGCNLNRNTHQLIGNAGFASIDMHCFMLDAPFFPITPHIFGQAIK